MEDGKKMKYNTKYKILFKFNPLMQCILGQFFGWQLVMDAYNCNCRDLQECDKVLFTYSNQSQFNKLVKHIQKMEI